MNEKIYINKFIEYIPHIETVYKTNLKIHFSTCMPLLSSNKTQLMAIDPTMLSEKNLIVTMLLNN